MPLNTKLPLPLLREMINEAAEQAGVSYDSASESLKSWLIYEAFGQAIDSAAFGPAVTAPVAYLAGLDLLHWTQWLEGESLHALTCGPDAWKVFRTYRAATEAWDLRIFARSEWMAKYAVHQVANDWDVSIEEITLPVDEEREMWGESVRLAEIWLNHVSDPTRRVVSTETNPYMIEPLLVEPYRWMYDLVNDRLPLAAVYGDLPGEASHFQLCTGHPWEKGTNSEPVF